MVMALDATSPSSDKPGVDWFDDIEVRFTRGLLNWAHVAPECYEKLSNIQEFIDRLASRRAATDIVTFGQRVPDVQPRFPFRYDWVETATLRVSTFEHWLNNQIIKENKKNVAKARKKGIEVRVSDYDDAFVKGIKAIYDESPVRQGKKFWHYGKDLERVRHENGTYRDESVFLGAYFDGELIGFAKLVFVGRCANTQNVISLLSHRDKKTNNALLAGAVELCAKRKVEYLQYGNWASGTFGKFKADNGFERVAIPFYYVPLTLRGRIAMATKLHRGIRNLLPESFVKPALALRSKWHAR